MYKNFRRKCTMGKFQFIFMYIYVCTRPHNDNLCDFKMDLCHIYNVINIVLKFSGREMWKNVKMGTE